MRGRRRRFVSTFRRFSSAKKLSSFMSYVVGLRFKRQGIREIVEVCILTLGHSPRKFSGSRQSAAADCVTVYPARLPLAYVHCASRKTFFTRAWKRGSFRTLS